VAKEKAADDVKQTNKEMKAAEKK